MAQITWRNVNGPNFGDVAGLVSGAARTFDQAFGALNDAANAQSDISAANYKAQQVNEQQAYDRGQDALANDRADAGLLLRQNQDARSQIRLEDDMKTNGLNRTLRQEQEKRAKSAEERAGYTHNRRVAEDNRADVNREQKEAAEAAIQGIVDSATLPEEYPRLVREYAQQNGLDPAEEATMLSNVRNRDQNLFGLTETQQRVVQEQQAADNQASQILDRELGIQEQTVATQLGVDPQLLALGQSGNTDITAQRNALDKRLDSGGSADVVKYFTEKVGRAPTVEEFDYIVGRSEEVDATPFFGGGTEFKGITEGGFETVIDEYRDAIGKGDDKEQRDKVNQYLRFTDKTNTLRRNAANNREDRLYQLQLQQRENNKGRYDGLSSNPVTAQTGNTESTNRSLAELDRLYQTLTSNQ